MDEHVYESFYDLAGVRIARKINCMAVNLLVTFIYKLILFVSITKIL